MRVKIHGGTASATEPPLCATCRFATIIKGARLHDEMTYCSGINPARRIPFPVVSCSEYSDRRNTSVREMEEIAWVLRSDPKKNTIGFVHAMKLKIHERYVLDED